jgi:hypothetical protein
VNSAAKWVLPREHQLTQQGRCTVTKFTCSKGRLWSRDTTCSSRNGNHASLPLSLMQRSSLHSAQRTSILTKAADQTTLGRCYSKMVYLPRFLCHRRVRSLLSSACSAAIAASSALCACSSTVPSSTPSGISVGSAPAAAFSA